MDDPAAPTDKEHRFLVRSAEEAVRTIREQLGENAQVTSVRRVERGGLSGMFRGAQLEVIARVPTPPGSIPDEFPTLPAPPAEHLPVNPWDSEELRASDAPLPSAVPEPTRAASPAPTVSLPAAVTGESRVANLLRRAGMSDLLLARLQASPGWPSLERLPLPQALAETVVLLRREYAGTPRLALGARVAFVGRAGAGSTSLLCKHLARCVFSLGQPAAVYRLGTDRPNPIDGLATVCELWGVPLLRSEEEMPAVRDGTRLYIDVPGLTRGPDEGEEAKVAELLEKLDVGSRVFVLNAAYEPALLKSLCRRAELLGCQHLGFTHLDELLHWGKMWEFLLHRDLHTAFYSLGPEIPGEFTEDILEATLGKTFG